MEQRELHGTYGTRDVCLDFNAPAPSKILGMLSLLVRYLKSELSVPIFIITVES